MKVFKVLLSHCGFPCHLVQDFQILLATIKKKEKKYDKRELRMKKRDRNKRKNKREITKRGREWIINIYHTLPWSFKTINLMPQPNSGSKCSFIECNTWNSNADKRIQKFKKIFLLICQFRNEREAGEKTAPWNAIVLGLLLRKSIINEGPDYMSLAVLARFAKLASIAKTWFSQITLHWLSPWGKHGHLYTFQTQWFLNPGYVSEREVFKT